MTYFLSPGPRSSYESPATWPEKSENSTAPRRSSVSPEIAWMVVGMLWIDSSPRFSAVTTTSDRVAGAELSAGAASAAAARPGSAPRDTRLARQSVTVRESLFFWLVIVIDAGIVAGADHTDDIDAVRGCCLQGVELLARQENHVSCRDTRLLVFRPHVTLAGQHDDRLFVEVTMRCSLGARYVADELCDDLGSDPLVHEDLEVSRAHRGTLVRIHRHDPLFAVRVEVGGHFVQPGYLAQRTGKNKQLQRLPDIGRELNRFGRPDVHPVGGLHGESAARDRHRAGTCADEQDHVTRTQAHDRRCFPGNLHQQLRLVQRAHLGRDHVAVAQ